MDTNQFKPNAVQPPLGQVPQINAKKPLSSKAIVTIVLASLGIAASTGNIIYRLINSIVVLIRDVDYRNTIYILIDISSMIMGIVFSLILIMICISSIIDVVNANKRGAYDEKGVR